MQREREARTSWVYLIRDAPPHIMESRHETYPSLYSINPDIVLLRRPDFTQVKQFAQSKAQALVVNLGQLFEIIPSAQPALQRAQYSFLW